MVLVGLNWLFIFECRNQEGGWGFANFTSPLKKEKKKSEVFSILRLKINKSECWTFNSPVRAGTDLSCRVGNVAGDVTPQ